MSTEQAVRIGVLRDHPLQPWAAQNEYNQALLREFSRLLNGEQSQELRDRAPGSWSCWPTCSTAGTASSCSRSTLRVRPPSTKVGTGWTHTHPPVEVTPALQQEVRAVLEAADDFCRSCDLLTLPRPPWMVALSDWVRSELIARYNGAAPTPWPGPFDVPPGTI